MDQNNFIDTVCKKLNLDYSKGILGADADFLDMFKVIDQCDIDMSFTDKASEISGIKQALICMKVPAESKSTFDKYNQTIVSVAKDLFGTRDGYTICGLECGVLAQAEAQAV